MSVSQEIKRVLFPSQTLSRQNNERLQSQQPQKQESILSTLKQNICTQQKERIKNKYERNLKCKQQQLLELTKKYEKLEMQYKNISKNHQIIIQQKNKIQEQYHQLTKQSQQKETKLHQKQEFIVKSNEQQITSLKNSIKSLSQQLSSQQQKMAIIQKQHKIVIRRSNTTLQQTRSQLQSKLTIKQKQQEKVEALFQQKKQEYNLKIAEKDQEIAYLLSLQKDAKRECERLENQLEQFQNEKIDDFQEFQKGVNAMQSKISQMKSQHKALFNKIQTSIHTFKHKLGLTCDDEDLFILIQRMQQQLITRKQPKENEQKIKKYQLQIQILKQNEKDLINKNKILSDQIAFIRDQNIKNNDFAAIIKSHIKQVDVKINSQTINKIFQSHRPPKTFQRQVVSTLLPLQTHQSQELPLHDPSKQPKTRKIFAQKSIDVYLAKSKGKTTNDYLKEQLQSKKRSLIYLMYRPSQDKQNHFTDQTLPAQKQQSTSTSAPSVRRRSNSLGNLISAKCREHVI